MLDKPHRLEVLPKWAQAYINVLLSEINHLQALKKLHSLLADKDRDWFTLPGPVNGCNQDHLSLWVLHTDDPMPVCTLYKGDMLFVGRAKEKEGERLNA